MSGRKCSRARQELMRGVDRVPADVAGHLESCDDCAAFAARFAVARDGLHRHRAVATPDAGFAARVTAALPMDKAGGEAMSRAAARLLPATLALALLLGAWCWLGTSSPASLAESASGDDVLAWVLDEGR